MTVFFENFESVFWKNKKKNKKKKGEIKMKQSK
jgi:hypothetical protein